MVTPKQDTTECIEAAVILSSLRSLKYMKIDRLIPIQSYSDIITNSSSELFCTITSEKHLKEIYQILDSIVGYRQEPEIDVCIDYCSKSNIEKVSFIKNCQINGLK